MEENSYHFTEESARKLFRLKFENDWLFKQKKQPWQKFHKILLQNGFPEDLTVRQISKKWTYTYDMYKLAKKTGNKKWKYFKLFDKYLGKSKNLDKYEPWDDEWRLKLITCISEAKKMKVDIKDLWRTVEMAMRCQDLPLNCCIQDIKGLWRYIRLLFNKKYRAKYDKNDISDWPLYAPMHDYYSTFEEGHLESLDNSDDMETHGAHRMSRKLVNNNGLKSDENNVFQWTKDITESFIQIRLQNDELFRYHRKHSWSELLKIMVEEYGFPRSLNAREIGRKWAATYSEYQKAKATNKPWLYSNLFDLYLGDGNLSLNPAFGWSEESLFNLINARTETEHLFRNTDDKEREGWREVEKKLRARNLPLDHSLLDLPYIWAYLMKTFKWKQKFASKGTLKEHWPFYDAMTRYVQVKNSCQIKTKEENYDGSNDNEQDINDDDYEDNMKLFDLKQKIKPKLEYLEGHQCRSCSSEEGCVNIFEQKDKDELNLAEKLKIICGVEVEPSDLMPSQICIICVQELENAYKFRLRCQEVDKQNKANVIRRVKIEINSDDQTQHIDEDDQQYDANLHTNMDLDVTATETELNRAKLKKKPTRKKVRKEKYVYHKICEICGALTKNLVAHLDMHSTQRMYNCDLCSKSFKYKTGLTIHRAVHSDTPRKTCEVCGKTFHIMAQYRRHFVYHANERKFECDTCNKRFNTIDILRVHIRTHTDERPFTCPVCGKSFRTAGCVARHKRIVHRSIPKSQ